MSDQLPPYQRSTSRPVMVLASTVSGGAALIGVLAAVPQVPWYVITGLSAVVAVGTAVGGQITQARTVPWEDTAAKVTPSGKVVAGPAAPQPTGTVVAVVKDDAPPSFQPGTSVYPDDRDVH